MTTIILVIIGVLLAAAAALMLLFYGSDVFERYSTEAEAARLFNVHRSTISRVMREASPDAAA